MDWTRKVNPVTANNRKYFSMHGSSYRKQSVI